MSMCNVLAILGDDEDQIWPTLDAAVALADAENARLTLAKTCDDGLSYVWMTPFAVGGVYLPPSLGSPADAARLLARVAEQVPNSIPLTTIVLGADSQASLVKLLRAGQYGAVVASADLLKRCRRVRRQLRRDEIRAVAVTRRPAAPPSTDSYSAPVPPPGQGLRAYGPGTATPVHIGG